MKRKKNHHNGAGTPRRDSPPKKKKAKNADTQVETRKPNKLENLTKQLEEEQARTTALMEALEKERSEKAALQASVAALQTANSATDSSVDLDGAPRLSSTRRVEPSVSFQESRFASTVDLDGAPRLSSTRRVEPSVSFQESRFASSVNQLSVSSLTIPECKPLADDEEITRHCYEMWKDLLLDSMKLAGIEDEETKFVLFRIKAGPRLLGIYNNTKSVDGAPDQEIGPFSNALHRLKSYFGSGSDIMLQRRKLALMTQKQEESDLAFVNRVASTARLCEYSGGKELEEIIGTIAGHAQNREVRTAALRILNRGGSVTDLVDAVREIETIQINEEYFRLKHGKPEPALIAPIRADYPRNQALRNRSHPYHGNGAPLSSRDTRFRELSGRDSVKRGITGRRGMVFSRPREDHCWRCGSAYHSPQDCPAIGRACRNCGRIGHFQRACQLPMQSASTSIRNPETTEMKTEKIAAVAADKMESDPEPTENVEPCFELNVAVVEKLRNEGIISAKVAGLTCEFLIDSGAQVNTFTEELFRELLANADYREGVFNVQDRSDRSLKAYALDGDIPVVATFEAYLFISKDRPVLIEKFYVVKELRSLLSKPTASRYSVLMLGLKVPVTIGRITADAKLPVEQIAFVNGNEPFPKFNIPPVKISYNKNAAPCRNIFTNIPLAVKPLVQQRLEQLVSADIIEPVSNEMDVSFCSSMLVIPKGKDDIRLVIDLRGPNQYISRTPFAMPTLEKILAELNGACWFSTIDMSNAFYHIELDVESRHLTNFFTEFGVFRCVRLPFGLCNAPDIFQEVLQRIILSGCKGVKNYLDDILVSGKTKEEHDANLAVVLSRLRDHNVKINESKSVFGSKSVKFLGFVLTANGWRVENEKIGAIKDFRRPTTCSEVKSFLGLVTFTDKFIMNRADKTEYLRTLANSDRFYWTNDEETEFNFLRNDALKTIKELGYYSATEPLDLFVDASPIGLGAVVVQYNSEAVPRIIACASKALTVIEQRYPHTQKEALAVVWAVERFSYYLLGRSFVIRTDAEANEFIFSTNHHLGKRAVSRAETWALRLQPYDFAIERVPGERNVADALSRLIQETQQAVPFEEEDTNNFLYTLDPGNMEMTWEEIERFAAQDEELIGVNMAVKSNRWPESLRKFEAQKKSLHFLGHLVFKDDRAVLPKGLRLKAMTSAHGGHVGEVAMKRIMREFFWWPGMSKEVVQFVKNCETCAMLARKNPPVPLSSREIPDGPWEIIQIDFLSIPGFGSGEFLVVLDTYSRYLFVVEMKHTDADNTNAALSQVFQTWGCPLVIQSDNGPPFQSSAFISCWESKGIKIRKSIPLCPQTNGAVERQNQGIVKAVAASRIDGENWKNALQRYIHNHNTLVPHSRLGVTPFEMLVGWKYRGTFPSLWSESSAKTLDRTDIQDRDSEAKLVSNRYANVVHGAKESDIGIGDVVLMAQQRKSKVDPTFSSDRFTVIAREGAKVVLISKCGVQYSRNVRDVRKAPAIDNRLMSSEEPSEDIEMEADGGLSVLPEKTREIINSDPDASPQTDTGMRTLRQRGNLRKPTRFDDQFIYNIFC